MLCFHISKKFWKERRLSTFALKARFFSNLYFGAIPGRSVVDATATLTHDVEKAMQKQNVVTALAFDIKGAFDNVSKNKLIKRLWDQKISLFLICWTDSFLTQRTAAIIRRQNRNPADIRNRNNEKLASVAYSIYVVYNANVQDPKQRKQKGQTQNTRICR